MASLNYLYLKVTHCSACTLLGSMQTEQGRKLMCKRACNRSNYNNHAPGLTIFRVGTRLADITCNTITNVGQGVRKLGEEPGEESVGGAWEGTRLEEPEQANVSHHCTTQGHANGLLVNNPMISLRWKSAYM